jgi:hypothetical protein
MVPFKVHRKYSGNAGYSWVSATEFREMKQIGRASYFST